MWWFSLLQANQTLGDSPQNRMIGETSVYLITGGLVMLGVVVLLVLVRALFPVGRGSTDDLMAGLRGRSMRSTPTIEGGSPDTDAKPEEPDPSDTDRGAKAASGAGAHGPEEFLRFIADKGWGEPRVLRATEGRWDVRIYDCAECGDSGAEGAKACGAQVGYLQAAFSESWERSVRVSEHACRRAGAAACDFEVAV